MILLEHKEHFYDAIVCHYCNKIMGYEWFDVDAEYNEYDRICMNCWKKNEEAVGKLTERQQEQIKKKMRFG